MMRVRGVRRVRLLDSNKLSCETSRYIHFLGGKVAYRGAQGKREERAQRNSDRTADTDYDTVTCSHHEQVQSPRPRPMTATSSQIRACSARTRSNYASVRLHFRFLNHSTTVRSATDGQPLQ